MKPRQSFISVIGVVQTPRDAHELRPWLERLFAELSSQFTDFEFVIVNNQCSVADIDRAIQPLPEELRKNIFLLNLSTRVDKNNALLAGLDRANGDYTVIFEFDFSEKPDLVTQLWERAQAHFDIVYLRAKERKLPLFQRLMYALFYGVMRRYSGLRIDERAHHSRIISRRALNSLLRLRENSGHLKAIYSLVGYNTDALDVDEPLMPDLDTSFADQFGTSLLAITSFTTFLRSMMGWIFFLSFAFAGAAIFNAVKVKLTGIDLFGTPTESVTGWAFLVVLCSVFFAITCLNLYIISIYLSNIYAEIKNRPLYIIESVRRY